MGVAAILHTGLTVSDLDRSVAFYRDLRGPEPIAQWDSSQPYLRAIVAYPDAELRARAGRAATRTPSTMLGGFRLVDSTR
jgi:catechol 2,3-dioxygenase-like lactoylglutathione lyase family enzyme